MTSSYSSSVSSSSMKLSTLIAKKTWTELHDHISTTPRDILTWTNGYLPIHRACWSSTIPHTIIEALVKIYPHSLQQACHVNGDVPLQYAVRCHYSSTEEATNHERIIQALLHYDLQPEKEFQTACFKDKHGHTPLHSYICYHAEPSFNIIQMLLEAYPEAIQVKDNYDWLPLHFASRNDDWKVVEFLLDLYPEGLVQKTKFNYTARDLASMFERFENYRRLKSKEENVKLLYQRNDSVETVLHSNTQADLVKEEDIRTINGNRSVINDRTTNTPPSCNTNFRTTVTIDIENKKSDEYSMTGTDVVTAGITPVTLLKDKNINIYDGCVGGHNVVTPGRSSPTHDKENIVDNIKIEDMDNTSDQRKEEIMSSVVGNKTCTQSFSNARTIMQEQQIHPDNTVRHHDGLLLLQNIASFQAHAQ